MRSLRDEPNRHTCPDIDAMQSTMKDIIAEMEKALDLELPPSMIENLNNWIYWINDECVSPRSRLEYLRESNSELRSWGNDLVAELEAKDVTISELEQEANEYADKVDYLQRELGKLDTSNII